MVSKVKFYNGNDMPALDLGTRRSQSGEVIQAVKDAIDFGYRHVDCAYGYGNEKEVGLAIAAKVADGTIKREDLFVTSKLWNTHHRRELVEVNLRETLADLGVDYVDLYLVHWPVAYQYSPEKFPKYPDGTMMHDDVDYLDTWRAMEDVLAKGLARNIGVSNFNAEQIDRLVENCKVKPVANQIECHPYLAQKKLSGFCRERGIVVIAYSPLGSPGIVGSLSDEPKLMDDKKLIELGRKYGKSISQLLVRYQLDRGHAVIPKSVTKTRILENSKVFDFKLTPKDVAYIDSFDCNKRTCILTGSEGNQYFPFRIS